MLSCVPLRYCVSLVVHLKILLSPYLFSCSPFSSSYFLTPLCPHHRPLWFSFVIVVQVVVINNQGENALVFLIPQCLPHRPAHLSLQSFIEGFLPDIKYHSTSLKILCFAHQLSKFHFLVEKGATVVLYFLFFLLFILLLVVFFFILILTSFAQRSPSRKDHSVPRFIATLFIVGILLSLILVLIVPYCSVHCYCPS